MGAFELPCDAGSSAPHCLAQPSCEETGCETVDPCRPAACLNDRCLETTLVGFPAAQCVCARDLPASCPTTPRLSGVARRVARACASLGLAADPARARQQGRFLAKAQRTFDRARLQVGRRAVASQIPAACATDLDVDLRDAVERVGWLIK